MSMQLVTLIDWCSRLSRGELSRKAANVGDMGEVGVMYEQCHVEMVPPDAGYEVLHLLSLTWLDELVRCSCD